MKKLLKKIIVIALSLAVFVGTFFIEENTETLAVTVLDMKVYAVADESGANVLRGNETITLTDELKELRVGDEVQTSESQEVSIKFDDNGVIRVGSSTLFSFKDETEDGYIFKMTNGNVWVNNMAMSSSLNVLAGTALIIPRRASLDIDVDTLSTKVRVFSNQATVGLVKSDFEPSSVVRFQNGQLINSFLVSEGGQAVVHREKVNENAEKLNKLLYSKLIKEFQYSLMDMILVIKEPWISKNLVSDITLYENISSEKLNKVSSRGLKYSSLDSFGYQVNDTLNDLYDVLTFTEDKKNERLLENINDHILDAEYLLTFGRKSEASTRLNLYKKLVDEEINSRGDDFKQTVLNLLRKKYSDLHFVLPSDPLYAVKTILSDLLISHLGHSGDDVAEKLGYIRDYMNYAHELADTDQLLARLSLEQYYNRFTALIKAEKNQLVGASYLISEENQIMDNLLKQYSQFYQDTFFAMKYSLEKEWLKLIPEGNEKDEERQTIISTKIDFLKRVRTFFLDEKLNLTDARAIVNRLIKEIKEIQPVNDIGVSRLFALRLQDYGTFLQFLNTTDVSMLRGKTPTEKYEEFLAIQREQISIEQVVEQLFGDEGEEVGISSEQIESQIISDFEEIDVTNLKIGAISGIEQELVEIESAELNGVIFTCVYDWNRKLVSSIESDGEVISKTVVRISALSLLIKSEEEVVEPEVIEEEKPEPAEVSQAERVAKILLIQKLNKYDIEGSEANITVDDIEKGIFGVNSVNLRTNKDVQISFVFSNQDNAVSELVIKTPVGYIRAKKNYDIFDLGTVASQMYEQAVDEAEGKVAR